MTTYTIISKQDTYVKWDRCSGYDGTIDGGFNQEWFSNRETALEYWTDVQLKNRYVIPSEKNSYQYELTLYIDGKSTSISWQNLEHDNDEYERLSALEQEFFDDVEKLFKIKESEFLAKREQERLEKERKINEAKQNQIIEAERRKREQDLATLAKLKAQYE